MSSLPNLERKTGTHCSSPLLTKPSSASNVLGPLNSTFSPLWKLKSARELGYWIGGADERTYYISVG